MCKKLPVNGFKWATKLHEFNENFTKNYEENSDEGYILEVDVEYPKNYLIYIKTYHFYLRGKKLER